MTHGTKGTQGGGFCILERTLRVKVLMAVDSGVSPYQMDFWDGMESVFLMPSITPAGTGRSMARAALSGMWGLSNDPRGAGDSSDTHPGVLGG